LENNMLFQQDSGISPVQASATGAASASNATMPAVAGKTNWIEGFDITGCGATTGATITVTVTGLNGGTMSFAVAIAQPVTVPAIGGNGIYSVRFPEPLPASAVNTAITVNVPSFGAGSTAQSCAVYGYTK
jgi:hypothetical protein